MAEKRERKKDRTVVFRVSSADRERIRAAAKRTKMTVTDYLTSSALSQPITVIDGLEDVNRELKGIGRNLNQLTTLAHMGRLNPEQIHALTDKIADLHNDLFLLTKRK
jgi:biotin synthase-like enzyme